MQETKREGAAATALREHCDSRIAASVIITTYNRCHALVRTLAALACQSIPADQYEILVVDDGSTDNTSAVLIGTTLACPLRVYRQPQNRGISAGRNLAMRQALGRYLICVSDDLIVPRDFIQKHLETHERFPGYWVVGAFRQLDSLTGTSFGRYLDRLEKSYEEGRKEAEIRPGLWEMNWPSARNLSLTANDLRRTGYFDEDFRSAFEDQDLAIRARRANLRFLYNASITCLHNDQAGDLKRHCRTQELHARDGAIFWDKHPRAHPDSSIAVENGWLSLKNSPRLVTRKLCKSALSTRLFLSLIGGIVQIAEGMHLPDRVLWSLYRLLAGLHIFRGWRQGLRLLEARRRSDEQISWPGEGLELLSGLSGKTTARESARNGLAGRLPRA